MVLLHGSTWDAGHLFFTLEAQYLLDNLGRGPEKQVVFNGMDPSLEVLEPVAIVTWDLLCQDGVAAVDFRDHVVHHDAGPVPLELAILPVLKCPAYGASTVILA